MKIYRHYFFYKLDSGGRGHDVQSIVTKRTWKGVCELSYLYLEREPTLVEYVGTEEVVLKKEKKK